jgi:hypothetical protein
MGNADKLFFLFMMILFVWQRAEVTRKTVEMMQKMKIEPVT